MEIKIFELKNGQKEGQIAVGEMDPQDVLAMLKESSDLANMADPQVVESLRSRVQELETENEELKGKLVVVEDSGPTRQSVVAFLGDATPDDVVAIVAEAGHTAELIPVEAPSLDDSSKEQAVTVADPDQVLDGDHSADGFTYLPELDISVKTT